jgi:Thioredoxin
VGETLSLAGRFAAGSTFEELLARPKDNSALWKSIYDRATLVEDSRVRAAALSTRWNLLVLNEDWCGDSVNILPHVARLAEANGNIEMRILSRDANRDLMDAHLTGSSRSIPVVIVYDEDFVEKGWWGPRPRALQQWMMTEGLALPKPDRYPLVRAWYARDKGRTIVSEILSIMEQGGSS